MKAKKAIKKLGGILEGNTAHLPMGYKYLIPYFSSWVDDIAAKYEVRFDLKKEATK